MKDSVSDVIIAIHNETKSILFPTLLRLIEMMEEVGQDTTKLKLSMDEYEHLFDGDNE